MEEERLRPPSPPPVVHYTDHEASAVSEKLKLDDTFTKAVQVSSLANSFLNNFVKWLFFIIITTIYNKLCFVFEFN